MKTIITILLAFSLIFTSCSKNDSYIEAIILEKGECTRTLLQFKSDLKDLPSTISHTYMVTFNKAEYENIGHKIYIKYRKPINDEVLMCPNLDFSYPQIVVVSIKE